MKKIKVLIIDRHPQVAAALKERLDSSNRFEALAAVQSLQEGARVAAELEPDVILLDANLLLDEKTGLDMSAWIEDLAGTQAGIIALAAYENEEEATAFLDAGGDRYLLKDPDPKKLLEEIEAVAGLS